MDILAFIGRRLLAMAALLAIVSFLVFGLLTLAPGSPEQTLLGTRPATPEAVAAIRDQYDLDEPFLERYGTWIAHAVQGDFGDSVQSQQPVTDVLAQRWPATLELALYAFAIALLVAIPAGMVAGVRRGGAVDRGVSLTALIGFSAPAFATGILLLYVFGVELEWVPTFGLGDGVGDRLLHLTLPAITLAIAGSALLVRQTRAAVMDVATRDYMTFARARGLSRRRIWISYALRNSALPIVTAGGLLLATMLTGAVLVEQTFGLPGMGSLLVESVGSQDIPVVQALTLITAAVVVAMNLAIDLVYLAVDPRIRHGRSR